MSARRDSSGHRARTRARRLAMQALYQWQLSSGNLGDIEVQFFRAQDMAKVDTGYFRELLHEVPAHAGELDERLRPILDRPFEQLDPVEVAILRIGTYELAHHPEVPWRVVINEGIELAKVFGADQSHRYINGILDRLAPLLRSQEVAATRQGRRQPA